MSDDVRYSSIVYDSRKASPGSAFFCLRGISADGHDFAAKAYDNGARVFFCEKPLDLPPDARQIVVENTRIELAARSKEFFGRPDEKLKIIGITGTKGKTTTANVVYQIMTKAGFKAAVIGTNGMMIDGKHYDTKNTTPESYELFSAFADMVSSGTTHCIMEVSSQAYKLWRVYGITFDCGVFTNLSPDHIGVGEHASFDEYMLCKSRLFENSKQSIINIDDDFGDIMIDHSKGGAVTFGISNPKADFRGSDIHPWKNESALGVDFTCTIRGFSHRFRVRTPGEYSVYNALAIIAVCSIYGIPAEVIDRELSTVQVKGRFEIIDALPWATFIIDYAHNEMSLRNVLATIREYSPKRLICLFGSVGDRTQIRRVEMGRIAAEYADFCILTSDNPGFEDPMRIIGDIERGIDGRVPYVTIPDRASAVEYAVNNAKRGDVILFAGKGHEDYQLVNGKKLPFSEREVIRRTCEKIKTNV